MSFGNENCRTSHSEYYLAKEEIKDYNFKIDGRNFFDQPINNAIKTCENIRKINIGLGDNYTTRLSLNYKMKLEN